MDGRDRIDADERRECPVEHRPIDPLPAERIGAVQDHEQLVVLGSGLHRQCHRGDVGVGAGSDVLQIKDQGVNAGQHSRRGAKGVRIQAVDGDGTFGSWHARAGRQRPRQTMLWCEQRHDADPWIKPEQRGGGPAADAGRGAMGNEANALAGEEVDAP